MFDLWFGLNLYLFKLYASIKKEMQLCLIRIFFGETKLRQKTPVTNSLLQLQSISVALIEHALILLSALPSSPSRDY